MSDNWNKCRWVERISKRSSPRDFKLSSFWVGVSPFLYSLEGLRINCSVVGLLRWTDLLTDFSFSFPLVTLFLPSRISQSLLLQPRRTWVDDLTRLTNFLLYFYINSFQALLISTFLSVLGRVPSSPCLNIRSLHNGRTELNWIEWNHSNTEKLSFYNPQLKAAMASGIVITAWNLHHRWLLICHRPYKSGPLDLPRTLSSRATYRLFFHSRRWPVLSHIRLQGYVPDHWSSRMLQTKSLQTTIPCSGTVSPVIGTYPSVLSIPINDKDH